MPKENIRYRSGNTDCVGYLSASDKIPGKRPAVLIAHAWRGLNPFARTKADDLAALGYVGFAADLYGEGKQAEDNDEALQLMLPLFLDRKLLRERIIDAYKELKKHPLVDPDKIAGIGFCFGGLTMIEFLRSGTPVRGVISFHGLYGWKIGEHVAKKVANASKLSGKLLMLHGYKDPFLTQEDVADIQNEFNDAGVDWEMDIYGQAVHAFTNPDAKDEKGGMLYDPLIARRAESAMVRFLKEIFST